MRHPHADTIIAWANGAKIEFFSQLADQWVECVDNSPSWDLDAKYRVKPFDYVLYVSLGPLDIEDGHPYAFVGDAKEEKVFKSDSIKIIFDANTKEPKSVQLIKG